MTAQTADGLDIGLVAPHNGTRNNHQKQLLILQQFRCLLNKNLWLSVNRQKFATAQFTTGDGRCSVDQRTVSANRLDKFSSPGRVVVDPKRYRIGRTGESKMRSRTIIFSALLIFCLLACSSNRTKTRVWQAPDHTVTANTTFDIRPVADATEKGVKPEVLLLLALSLEEQFARKNLQTLDPGQDEASALLVKSEIQAYKINVAPSAKRWQKDLYALCVLRTRLHDKTTNEAVAEIFTINQTYFGRGMLEPKNPESVLSESAAAVAEEIAKLITD